MNHPQNPIPTVDIILQRKSTILLVKRKKDPFKDHFALPSGFISEGELTEEAIKREMNEECSVEVEAPGKIRSLF